ncbi:MAG: beta strand repeat-containing protein, partial [Fidelibacterota bacterium]
LDNALAISGEVITLSFASSENISTPTVNILGNLATVSNVADSSNWVATRTVGGGDSEGAAGFSISFSDLGGNNGTAVTALTGGDDDVVVDLTIPQITKASISTNNGTGDELSVPGDVVTLVINTSEAIQLPDVAIATQTAIVVQGANALTWSATYTMTTNESNGSVPFSVDYLDIAGNVGNGSPGYSTLINDDDGNPVSFDKTQPELTYVSLASDNSNTAPFSGYGRTGSLVTLSFESNEALSSNTVTINGNAAAVSYDAATDRYSATYTLVDGDTEGAVVFTIDYIDLNGYDGVQVVETLDASEVIFDKTAPEITTLTYVSSNANLATMAKQFDVITVDLEASENLQSPTILLNSNASGTPFSGGTEALWSSTYTVPSLSDGVIALQLDYKDYAGNSGTRLVAPTDLADITYDGTTPTLTTVTLVSDNNYSTAKAKLFDELTLTIVAGESIQTPVVTISGTSVTPTMGADNENWTATYIMQNADPQIDVLFTVDFRDLADNAGMTATTTSDGLLVNYDNTAPITTGLIVDLKSVSDTGFSDSDDTTTVLTPIFEIQNLTSGPALGTGEKLILNINGVDYDSLTISVDAMSIAVPDATPLTNSVLPYEVIAYIRDLAGNLSLGSTPLSIIVDTEAPLTNGVLNLMDGSDSGSDNTDDITNDNTPTLQVNGLADGQKYTVQIDYDLEGGASDQNVINQRMVQPITDQFTTTALNDGVYTFTYKLIDTAGNISLESEPIVITIDRTQPTIPAAPDLTDAYDTGTLNSDNLTNLAGIEFSIANLVIGESLEIYDDADNTLLGSKIITATTETIIINGFVESAHVVYAKVTDLAGNQCGETGLLAFEVDLTAIDVTGITMDLNTSDDSGALDDDELTNVNTPSLTISTVSTNDIVKIYATNVLVGTATSTGTSVSVTSSVLIDNPYVMSFTVTDYAGNVSLVSDNTLPITIDTTPWEPPVDLVLQFDTGADASDNVTNDQTPTFRISTGLDFAELDLIRLYSSDGVSNTLIESTRKTASKTFHDITVPDASALGEGSYDFTYDIVDYAGNVSLATSAALTITVDVTAPLYILNVDLDDATDSGGDPLDATDPLTIDNLTNSSNLSVTLSGFTAGDYAQLYYTYSVSGITNIVEPNDLVSVGDAGSKTYEFPHIGDGAYTIIGYSADLAGNDNAGVTLVVTVDTTPPDASLVTLDLVDASDTGGDPTDPTDPLTIDNLTNATTPNIIISGVSVADSVILYNDDVNNSVKARGLPAASTITLAQDLTAAADAAITFYATLKDAAGNESIASPVPLVVTLDTTAPLSGTTPPLPDLTDATDTGEFPADNKTYLQNPSFDLTLTGAFEPDSLILYAQTGITKSIVGRSIKVLNQEFGTIAVAVGKELTEAADYTMTYKLIDAAGNVSAESDLLTPLQVDLTFPDVPGDPNLEPLSDTGKSDSDNITNASTISIDMPGITSGLIGKLYTFTDVSNDGIFDFDDYGPDGIQATNDFGEGNGAYDEGEPSAESPLIVVADYSNNNAQFENWYLNDWALSGNDADCGCLDGTLTYNYATAADDSIAIGFFTIHEDLVGQRKQSANALIVQADRKVPIVQATVDYSDADYLVNAATGILTYTFTYKEELDSDNDPPRIDIRFPGASPNLDNQPLVYTGAGNIWKYDLDLSGYVNENGILAALDHFAQDVAGNSISAPIWKEVTIDNLPAEFTDLTPASGSFNNVLNNFGWTINEDLDPLATNAINFYQDNAVVVSYSFTVAELDSGDRALGNLGDAFVLADGVYTVSLETTDIVGNIGKFDITDYSYDTKNPSVAMTYTREVVTADSLVTITATFDEPVTTAPNLTLTAMDSLVLGSNSISVPMVLPGGCECLDNNGVAIPNCEPSIDEATCTDINGFNGTWDPDYYGVVDNTVWIYHYTAPTIDAVDLSITNSGPVDVWITSTDLATNTLYMVDNAAAGITGGFVNAIPLYIDNDVSQATYTYKNLSNSTIVDAAGNLTNYAGAGGDTIEVTITLNQPILTSVPVPELRYTYGSGTGSGITGITFISVTDLEDGVDESSIDPLTEANLIWKYNLVIPDLAEWDGAIDFNLIARDLSNVFILEENEITDSEFIVDNIHPATFETGNVTVAGSNPVQGWITGFINLINTTVPIPTQIEDPTIINGEVMVEFYNLNRGVSWIKIGENDIITEVGPLDFSRDTTDIYSGMVKNVDIITGDQIAIRASLIDRNGNLTVGTESVTQMAYDPTAPTMGSVTGGNFIGVETPQYSNDLVSLEWSEFLESDDGESGVQEYEILIRKLAAGDCDCLDENDEIIAECESTVDYTVCVGDSVDGGYESDWTVADIADTTLIDWTSVLPPTTAFSYQPILEHNQQYRAFVRAIDVAGNISTTLTSNILYRLNSAPVIT